MAGRGSAQEFDKHVGQRLRRVRVERAISQEKLAQLIDVTFQQIQKYETGTNRMSAGRLMEFAQIFQVPVTHFYEGLKAGETRPLAALSADAIKIAHEVDALGSDRGELFDIIRRMIRVWPTRAPVRLAAE